MVANPEPLRRPRPSYVSDDPRPDWGQQNMNSEQDKRRIAEEEIKKRATEKPNLATSASWVLAGILVLVLILTAM